MILGNPPYNGYAGLAIEEERDLSNAYRTVKEVAAPQGQGLNDLYVRFFRMAERRIVEKNGQGVICFISNYSWLDGLSFTGMRERYLDVFDKISIDCLNGDKYKTGKLTPEGAPDPSVFSTEFNKEGIQVGTAIVLLVRNVKHTSVDAVQFRHFWGKDKRAQLLEDVGDYQQVTPVLEMGLALIPGQMAASYVVWPQLPDLFLVSFPGVKTSRDDVVVDIGRERLVKRMKEYFDPEITHEQMRRLSPSVMTSTNDFKAEAVRDQLRNAGFCRTRSFDIAIGPLTCAGFIGNLKPSCSTGIVASIFRMWAREMFGLKRDTKQTMVFLTAATLSLHWRTTLGPMACLTSFHLYLVEDWTVC